jgi:hypothetical protein
MGQTGQDTHGLRRRDWLRCSALSLIAFGLIERNGRGATGDDAESPRLDALSKRLADAGVAPVNVHRTERYAGIGNASERFSRSALALCEALARDFLEHFTNRGFQVERVAGRLLVVLLADTADFAKFLGEAIDPAVRGVYDLQEDWLVMCDSRGSGGALEERANSVTLFHEATHQLCFDAGLLRRDADLPLAITEGLATYGEVRRPDGRTRIGAINEERLAVLGEIARRGGSLFSVEDLIKRDELLEGPDTRQQAYAQSWLLVHMMMRSREDARRFRAYLTAVGMRGDASERIADVRAHLGEAADLDASMKRHANRLLNR